MKGKAFRGFTLIELIVVIAIIGILAVILVPSMMGYVRMSRMRRFNSNAATVFKGAQLACVDIANAGGEVLASTVFLNNGDGDCECKDSNGTVMDISDYVGSEFKGYFGFITDTEGSGCAYAMWSESKITTDMLQNQMTEMEVKDTFKGSSKIPRGCHPLKQANE